MFNNINKDKFGNNISPVFKDGKKNYLIVLILGVYKNIVIDNVELLFLVWSGLMLEGA